MKRSIFLLVSLSLVFTAQAHFFAYQEWYNPKTGQILEEFYDNHATGNKAINNKEQQRALIDRAKKSGNTLVIVEDMCSLLAEQTELIDFKRSSVEYKNATKEWLKTIQFIRNFTIGSNHKRSPLLYLYTHCFSHTIPAFNIECRNSGVQEACVKEIASYQDGPLLNEFYRLACKMYKELIQMKDPNPYFALLAPAMIVDARALHTIASCTDKHLILAAGGAHCRSINSYLLLLGWQPLHLVVPSTLNPEEKKLLCAECLQTKLLNIMDENYSSEDVYSFIDNYWASFNTGLVISTPFLLLPSL